MFALTLIVKDWNSLGIFTEAYHFPFRFYTSTQSRRGRDEAKQVAYPNPHPGQEGGRECSQTLSFLTVPNAPTLNTQESDLEPQPCPLSLPPHHSLPATAGYSFLLPSRTRRVPPCLLLIGIVLVDICTPMILYVASHWVSKLGRVLGYYKSGWNQYCRKIGYMREHIIHDYLVFVSAILARKWNCQRNVSRVFHPHSMRPESSSWSRVVHAEWANMCVLCICCVCHYAAHVNHVQNGPYI